MEKYSVKFNRISVYGDADMIRYRIILNQEIPGYRLNANNEIVKANVDYIDVAPNTLIAQVIRCLPDLGAIHAYLTEKNLRGSGKRVGLDAAQLQVYLNDAEITLERTEFQPGDEYTTSDGEVRVHEYAGYNTVIAKINATESARRRIDHVVDTILLGGI